MNLRDGHYGEVVLKKIGRALNSRSQNEVIMISKNLFFWFGTLQDEEEPQDTQYQIDGSYIPRIFILGKQKIGWFQ